MESLPDSSLLSNPIITLREELGSIATNKMGSMKAIIANPAQQSEKISAEVAKILTKAKKPRTETRWLQLEANAITMRNYRDRVQLLRDLRAMPMQLERDGWVDIFQGAFGGAEERIALPKPKADKD